MRERPIKDLTDGLKQLGVDVTCSDTGCPPVRHFTPSLPQVVRSFTTGLTEGSHHAQ